MWVFFIGILFLKTAITIDTYIDQASPATYAFPLKDTKVRKVNGAQQLYILFSNNTVIRYSSSLVQKTSFAGGTKILSNIDVQVLEQVFTFYPMSYFGIIDGNQQFAIISFANTSWKYYISRFTNIKNVYVTFSMFSSSTNYTYEAIVFYEDVVVQFNSTGNTQSHFYNFSSTAPGRNYPDKIIQLKYNSSKSYRILTTTLKQLYTVRINYALFTGYDIDATQMLYDFSSQPQYIISLCTDGNKNIFVQFSNFSLFAIDILTSWPQVIDSGITSQIGSSILQAIKPSSNIDGQRVFIFNDQSLRVSLTSSVYSLLSVSQASLPFTQDVKIISLTSSTADFVYQQNTPTKYPYSEITTINSVFSVAATCTVTDCQTCNNLNTLCITCDTNYEIFNGECYLNRTCSVSDCQICDSSDVCLSCGSNTTLNSSGNLCQAPTTGGNITTNVTINNTTVDPTTNTQIPLREASKYYNKNKIQQVVDSFSPEVIQTSLISSAVNSFPVLRLFLGFLSPLFSFFDDYWYYIYHQDTYPQLQILPNFLVFMYVVNKDRILPDYLTFNNPLYVFKDVRTSNYTQYTSSPIIQIDQQETYLGLNLQDMVLSQYLYTAFILFIVKIVHSFIKFHLTKTKRISKQIQEQRIKNQNDKLNSEKRKKTIIQYIEIYLAQLITIKSIILSFISANLIFMVFQFSSQLRILFYFNFVDVQNMIATLILGLVLMCCVILIFLYQDLFGDKCKQNKKQINEEKRACQQITYFNHVKNLMFGCVHGFFIQSPNTQYVLLILTKFILLSIILSKKNIMKKYIFVILSCVYFSTGIFLDFLCLLSSYSMIPSFFMTSIGNSDISFVNILQFGSLLMIGLSIALQIFLQIFFQIKQFCFHSSKSQDSDRPKTLLMFLNKITPQNQVNQNSNQKKQINSEDYLNQFVSQHRSNQNSENQLASKISEKFKIQAKTIGHQKDKIQAKQIKTLKFKKIHKTQSAKTGQNLDIIYCEQQLDLFQPDHQLPLKETKYTFKKQISKDTDIFSKNSIKNVNQIVNESLMGLNSDSQSEKAKHNNEFISKLNLKPSFSIKQPTVSQQVDINEQITKKKTRRVHKTKKIQNQLIQKHLQMQNEQITDQSQN